MENNLSICIITHNSNGLLNDMKVYKKIFKKNGYAVTTMIGDDINVDKKYDKVLYLERIHNANNASEQIFTPNYELFNDIVNLKKIDTVLCKTQICYEYFNYLKEEHKMKYKTIYTKFTTYIPKEIRKMEINKDPNLFVLLAGSSPYKNVAHLIYNWLYNDCYLQYNPDLKLVITCRTVCYNTMVKIFNKYFQKKIPEKFKHNKYLIEYKNIKFYNKLISDKEYNNLLVNASVAICISSKEGYGHYINEARYFNTYVITFDYPPMNELINDKIGVLVKGYDKVEHELDFTKYKIYNVYPKDEELKKGIIKCIKNNITIKSRKYFIRDKKYLYKTITDYLQF